MKKSAMMRDASGYSLRSSSAVSRRNALQSKAASSPPTNKPKPRPRRHLSPSKVSNLEGKGKALPLNDHLEDLRAWNCEGMATFSRTLTTKALSYLQEQGQNFELVKLGLYEGGIIEKGARFHLNFKAKHAGDPTAPVETFFAQVRLFYGPSPASSNLVLKNPTIECCVSLGESDSLPDKVDTGGCQYCTKYIYHPVGGSAGLDVSWPVWPNYKESRGLLYKRRALALPPPPRANFPSRRPWAPPPTYPRVTQ